MWKEPKGLEFSDEPEVCAEELGKIDSYLIASIASLLFCFPGGIIAVIFSLFSLRAKRRGRYSDTLSYSLLARKFVIGSLVSGVILLALRFLGSSS